MKKIKQVGLAVLTCLIGAAAAKADVVYTWEQATTSLPGYTSSGTIDLTLGTFLFTEVDASIPYSGTVTSFSGTVAVLTGAAETTTEQTTFDNTTLTGAWVGTGDTAVGTEYQLDGFSAGTQTPGGSFILGWSPNVSAVPEPTTMIAGAFLLLPMGASTLRALRKNRAA